MAIEHIRRHQERTKLRNAAATVVKMAFRRFARRKKSLMRSKELQSRQDAEREQEEQHDKANGKDNEDDISESHLQAIQESSEWRKSSTSLYRDLVAQRVLTETDVEIFVTLLNSAIRNQTAEGMNAYRKFVNSHGITNLVPEIETSSSCGPLVSNNKRKRAIQPQTQSQTKKTTRCAWCSTSVYSGTLCQACAAIRKENT